MLTRSFTRWLLPTAVLSLAAQAGAQTVLFADDFESGLSNWSVNFGWHLVNQSQACMGPTSPFPKGPTCAWFGSESTCNFDPLPWDFANLSMAAPVSLPAGAPEIHLSFGSFSQGEDDGVWDSRRVYVNSVLVDQVFSSTWERHVSDLTPWAGQSINLRFEFWSGDSWDNGGIGWLVDDVVISTSDTSGVPFCFGDGAMYGSSCPCGNVGAPGNGCANSANPAGAHLDTTGRASLSSEDLVLVSTGTSGNFVTYFQGGPFNSAPVFVGDGARCVSDQVLRIGTVVAQGGFAQYPGPGDTPISVRGQITPGTGMRIYQANYRNAANYCTSATFNFTSGVIAVWRQ